MSGGLPLTRFIFSSRNIASGPRARWRAFLPDRQHQTSVFRIDDAEEDEIWRCGAAIAKRRGGSIHGRADFEAGAVYEVENLHLEMDETPPRHGNITGWPLHDDELEQKTARRNLAKELLARITRTVAPPKAKPPIP